MIEEIKGFDSSEIAKKRLEIIVMYENYVQEVTKKAYGTDRKVVTIKKRLKEAKGRLE